MSEGELIEPDDLIFSPIESANQNDENEDNETKLSTLEKNTY